jgi:DNA repair protein RecO (recombination protein O)
VPIQQSEAILLSKRDVRETSASVVFYTKNFGKIKGLIKGARGPQAKFGLYLHEFARYDIVYYEKSSSDTYLVTQCDLKEAYSQIAEDLDKRLLAYYILELVDKFTPLSEPSSDIYKLLNWALESLKREKFFDRTIIIFQLKLLEYAGFLPQLDVCVGCSNKITRNAYFSVRLSGLLCDSCQQADIQNIAISKGAIATINMIRKYQIDRLSRSTVTNETSSVLRKLLEKFIAYHLGEHLKTINLINQL